MRSCIALLAVLVAPLVAVLAAGCGADAARPTAQSPPAQSPAAQSPAAAPFGPHATVAASAVPGQAGAGGTGFGGTDAAWIQLMIALDESALRLVDLAATRPVDGRLKSLVDGLGPAHRAELGELRRLADLARLPGTNEHADHDMPGMVTAAELARIGALRGTGFDEAVRGELREHLEQCSRLAVSEQRSGTDPATKDLAARVQRARDADLSRL